jgi:succinyl-CoA synthetase alpha subunit
MARPFLGSDELPRTMPICFVAGRTISPGRTIGHAGSMVLGTRGSCEGKVAALAAAGVRVATLIEEIPNLLRK